jgi:hypothetical protein
MRTRRIIAGVVIVLFSRPCRPVPTTMFECGIITGRCGNAVMWRGAYRNQEAADADAKIISQRLYDKHLVPYTDFQCFGYDEVEGDKK